MKTFNLKSINEGNVSFRCCPQVETVIGAESCAGLTVSQEPTMVMQKTAAGRDGNWSGNKRGSYRLSKSATGRDGNWGGNMRGSYRLSKAAAGRDGNWGGNKRGSYRL